VSTIEELSIQISDLSARVQLTEDTLAIYDLKAQYAELVDQRYWRGNVLDDQRLAEVCEEIADLFAIDAVWDGGPTLGKVVGREAIRDRLHRTTLVFSRHLFVKPRIRIEGDRAWARWDILCPCKTADGRSFWMCGYEDDGYIRTKSRWLHQSMSLTTVFLSPTDAGFDRIFA
jgi:hypothetical protein